MLFLNRIYKQQNIKQKTNKMKKLFFLLILLLGLTVSNNSFGKQFNKSQKDYEVAADKNKAEKGPFENINKNDKRHSSKFAQQQDALKAKDKKDVWVLPSVGERKYVNKPVDYRMDNRIAKREIRKSSQAAKPKGKKHENLTYKDYVKKAKRNGFKC